MAYPSLGQPTEPCPYCGEPMEADWVHNGVGYQQCGPYHCFACGASEIGPEATGPDFGATEEERRTGFYRNRVSPIANTLIGVPVHYRDAEALHSAGVLDADRTCDDPRTPLSSGGPMPSEERMMPKHTITITCDVEAEPGTMPEPEAFAGKLKGLLMLRPGLLGRGTRILRETLAVTSEPKER